MQTSHRAVLLIFVLFVPLLAAGCTAPTLATDCTAETLVRDAVAALSRLADPEGGIPPHPTGTPDPRTTAWVLLATGLARRTGQEGGFDAQPHAEYLKRHLTEMAHGNTSIDSAPNNLSLARAALQTWGRPASGLLLDDPDHPDVRTLEEAWEARYDPTTGRYGARFNEHLFGAFAAWIFGPAGERLHGMAAHTADTLHDPGPGGDPTERDAWWAAYARAALGTGPSDTALAQRLEGILDDHQDDTGGVRGFASAEHPDASTTAAALLAWQRSGEPLDGPHVGPAVEYLCDVQRDDGLVPFSARQPILHAKTTAEVTIALALHLQPIPWAQDVQAS